MSDRKISGNLSFDCAEANEAMVFVAAFTARSREEGWDVNEVQVEIKDQQ